MTDRFAPEINLDTAAAAKRLGVSDSFLAKARMRGTGPRYSKFGRAVLYTPANLDRYQLERSRTSTAEQPDVTASLRKHQRRLNVSRSLKKSGERGRPSG
jgi:hypothetical protein